MSKTVGLITKDTILILIDFDQWCSFFFAYHHFTRCICFWQIMDLVKAK